MRTLTYKELRKRVDALPAALMGAGVEKGDAVAVFMPMVPEAIVAAYAVGKMGALWMPIFSGFGARGGRAAARREAKVLVTADGTWRRGKQGLMKGVADEAVAEARACRPWWCSSTSASTCEMTEGRDVTWADFVAPRGRTSSAPTPAPRTRS